MITAEVKTDGSMRVEEKRTYTFNGDYTFAYQTINKLGDGSDERSEDYHLSLFSICDQYQCYRRLAQNEIAMADNTRPVNTFYVIDRQNDYYLKWFYRASDEARVFSVTYNVDNAITLEKDTAELYWKWIGDGWELNQSAITAKLLLPPGIPDTSLQAWAHGPWTGKVSIPTAQEVDYSLSSLPAKTFFEGRVLMPKTFFTGGAHGMMSVATIKAQEQMFIEQTNNDKAQALLLLGLVVTIGGLLLLAQLYFLLRNIVVFKQYGMDTSLPEVSLSGRIWEAPSEIDPPQIEQLISGRKDLTTKSLTATILSLVRDRFYRIKRSDQKEGFIFKSYTYSLEPLTESTKEPTAVQAAVLAFLKQIALDIEGATIPLSQISDYCRSHRMECLAFFKETFPQVALQENLDQGLFDKAADGAKSRYSLWLSGAILFGGLIGGTVLGSTINQISNQSLPMWIVMVNFGVALVSTILSGIMLSNAEKRTRLGAEEAAKWLAFKKHLEEYRQTKNDPIDSIVIWENYLVYGTLLGVSSKTLSELPLQISENEGMVAMGYWGGYSAGVGVNFGASIGSISEALSSVSSAVSTSYGASGAGGGGGAG